MLLFCFHKSVYLRGIGNEMANNSYISFRNRFYPYGCFSIHQVLMWDPKFETDNLTRWIKQGLLVRLRRGWLAFAEYLGQNDFAYYVSGRIYKPSYISLQTALSYYGIIPEAVTSITSVSTLKTQSFKNSFGDYYYQSIKPSLFFGYEIKTLPGGQAYYFATPDKALLDFLYLNPMYNSEEDMLELRLDDSFLSDDFDGDRLKDYLKRFDSKVMTIRLETLYKAYGL